MGKRVSKNNHGAKRNVLRHLVPVTIWLLALSVVVWLFYQRTQRFQVLGVAQRQMRQVAANCAGRLTSVPVRLYDRVEAGQVVAVVDTVLDNEIYEATLEAQLNTIMLEIEHLGAEIIATQEDLEARHTDRITSRISDLRRFSVDVENSRLRILEFQAQLATNRMALREVATEVRITEDLAAREAVPPFELDRVRTQYEALVAQIEEDEKLLEQAQVDLETAQQRLSELADIQPSHPSVESALEVIRKAIAVEEGRMKEILAEMDSFQQRHSLELRSPVNGVVSQIWRNAGEAVTAGDPIVTIAETRSSEVIGYAQASMVSLVRENMSVVVIKPTEPMQMVEATITYVGPVVEEMPAQLWQNPAMPQWGRPFVVTIPPDLAVIPGEVVGIRGL